jgi:hypothetical protein
MFSKPEIKLVVLFCTDGQVIEGNWNEVLNATEFRNGYETLEDGSIALEGWK